MTLQLPPHLRRVVDAEYPRFSTSEMARRRAAVEGLLAAAPADHLIYCGANRFGSAVQWLTQWPVTAEAVGVFSPGLRDALFVQYCNHVPQAKRLAEADVAWGGESSVLAACGELARRGARRGRIAAVGPLTVDQHALLGERFGKIANLNAAYLRQRMVKSQEEVEWLRIGACMSDRAMIALRDGLSPGLTERQLADIIDRAYVADGGTSVIRYIGVTPMNDPHLPVPAQFASTRRVAPGDIVFAEISVAWWDYPGQVLRSFAVGVEPPPLYAELHTVADAAFDAIARVLRDGASPTEVVAASGVIERAGYTTIDDLLHGYGGGYLPPVLGSLSRPAGPMPEEPFMAGMTVVIQPNVVTPDGRAGVQTGEMVLVTATGCERLHAVPRGFARV